MAETNWKYLGELGLAVILLIALLALFVTANADAAETTGSYVLTDSPVYPYHAPYRLTNQGQTVYVNDTVDISGQGWGSGIVWYGRYDEYEDPQYIYEFTPYKRDVQNFYINPAIFYGKSGMWYQYYGNLTERNGNLRAFRVSDFYRNNTVTYPNGTIMEISEIISEQNPDTPPPKKVILPEIRKSDYLIATGDPLFINSSRVWLFGRIDGMYAHDGNFTIHDIQQLETGSYKIVTQEPGNNTILEVGYDSSKQLFTSPWKGVDDESVYGSQPMLDINKFYYMVGKTDDKIKTYNMDLEEPAVSIISIDEVDVGNRVPYAWEPGVTLLDVRGYTNVQNNSVISFVMDSEKQTVRTIGRNTWYTNATRSHPGNMSIYQVYIPINKNQMPNGVHTIKVSTAIGGSMYHDFVISELPADSYVPNATLKYIMGRNPWEPNLTVPEPVVVVQTKVVEKVVEKPIPPSEETILEQQRVAFWEGATKIGIAIAIIGIAIIGMIGVFWAYRIHKRTMNEREWFKRQT